MLCYSGIFRELHFKGAWVASPQSPLPYSTLHDQMHPDESTPQVRNLRLADTVGSFVGISAMAPVLGDLTNPPSFLPGAVAPTPKRRERITNILFPMLSLTPFKTWSEPCPDARELCRVKASGGVFNAQGLHVYHKGLEPWIMSC